MRSIKDIRDAFLGKPARPECAPHCAPRHPGPKPIPGRVPPPCRLTPDKVENLDFTTEELNSLIRWMMSHKSQTEMLEAWGDSATAGLTQRFLTQMYQQLHGTVNNLADSVSDLEDTDARHDEAIDALASDINQLIADGAEVAVNLTPSVFFVGQQVSMTAEMTSSVSADELTLTNEATYETRSGTGTLLHWAFNYTASESGVLSVGGAAVIRGYLRLADAKAYAVLPIYYGTSATRDDYSGAIQLATAKRSPAGSYAMTPAAGDYLYWIVPATMSIGKVTLSGFDVPMEAAQGITYNGKAYKVYKTKNTYQAGRLTLVVS